MFRFVSTSVLAFSLAIDTTCAKGEIFHQVGEGVYLPDLALTVGVGIASENRIVIYRDFRVRIEI